MKEKLEYLKTIDTGILMDAMDGLIAIPLYISNIANVRKPVSNI
jgi:hypothetical protein